MRYSYDNSAANVRNPHSPPVRVQAGNRSQDEMGHLWLQVLPVDPLENGKDARLPLERAWMQERLVKDPADSTALYNLASMDLGSGQSTTAETLLTRALHSRPGDARLLIALGLAYYREGRPQQAEATLATALAADPTYGDAQFDLARVQLDEGAFAKAEASFRSSIAADANDTAQAASLLETALTVRKDADAERLLGLIKARQGAMAEAIAHMQAARDLNPRDTSTHTYLARMYGQMQRWPDAVEEQKAALAIDATHSEDWTLLGQLEKGAGNATAAQQAFNKAESLHPK
jgi:tetratricopeptide (TPR) repeat protein